MTGQRQDEERRETGAYQFEFAHGVVVAGARGLWRDRNNGREISKDALKSVVFNERWGSCRFLVLPRLRLRHFFPTEQRAVIA